MRLGYARSLAPPRERWQAVRCLSLSSGAARRSPGLLGGAWSGTPTPGLGCPSHRAARLLQKLNRSTAPLLPPPPSPRPGWEPRGSRAALSDNTWGELRGDQRSRSRDGSRVVGGKGGPAAPCPDQEEACSALQGAAGWCLVRGGLRPSRARGRPLEVHRSYSRPPAEQRLPPFPHPPSPASPTRVTGTPRSRYPSIALAAS